MSDFDEAAYEAGDDKYKEGSDAIFVNQGGSGSVYYAIIDHTPTAVKVNHEQVPFHEMYELNVNQQLFQAAEERGLVGYLEKFVERKYPCYVQVHNEDSPVVPAQRSRFYSRDLTQAFVHGRIELPNLLAPHPGEFRGCKIALVDRNKPKRYGRSVTARYARRKVHRTTRW